MFLGWQHCPGHKFQALSLSLSLSLIQKAVFPFHISQSLFPFLSLLSLTRMSTAGAGGKIKRSRRNPAKTPYSRPNKSLEIAAIDEPGNPSWLSGLISPAKSIVSGAGKILSFFGSDSPSTSDDDDENSDNNEDEEVENDSSPRGESSHKVLSPSSKTGNKQAIKLLVMQEKFSREEGDELIKLIKSHIVDADGSLDESAANLRTTAITEAQKWLQQKRSGSKKKMEHERDITTLATPSMFTETGKGSPVDMAKSYMQNRPTWTSASKHIEYGSSSPLGIINFKEGTPKSTLHSSEMKRSSLSFGSRKILEELRRVRSKATEELLAAAPLTNTIKSSFFLESNLPEISLVNNGNVEITESLYDKPQNVKQDVLISHPTGVGQDDNVVQPMEHQECKKAQEAADLKLDEDDEVIQLRSTATENGFPSTASGLNAEPDASENAEPSEKVNGDLVGSVQIETDVLMEEDITNPKHETSGNTLNSDPDYMVPTGSQNSPSSSSSSSMQLDDEMQELSQRVTVLASKAKVRAPREERKSRGYTRRGRAKAK